ncbi:endonuclease domain-containing protein [Sphingomonas sp. PAMC 26605]|uniref:endonuclease domain-containing protein n=1 Tax=Sphingomonas sp. PAMC 26605 TaxID=1112214 RepID=UPI00026CCB85|nr:DUF559 domain-containing protein [Sphingomonas sp. PAMC 26605]
MGARYRLGRPTAEVRDLRNNATVHEELLWRQLKGKRLAGLKFSRQMPIAGYRVDFVCRAQKLIIELDGSQHSEAIAYDEARTRALEKAGYRVIRFWNNDLTSNMDGALEMIAAAAPATERAPTPYPLPQAGGETVGLASPDAASEKA